MQEKKMDQVIYNSIGQNYNRNRRADFRITSNLIGLLELPTGAIIADIGAGTGNYAFPLANYGYKIMAIEPSEEMRKQAAPHKLVHWLSGYAESIPLPDNSVDGVIIVLALHHFHDVQQAVRELARICPEGPIVVFTMDPREGCEFWFNNYFPEIGRFVDRLFPPVQQIIDTFAIDTGWSSHIKKFPLPFDLLDLNGYSGWNRPELYLDPQMRQNTSGFALADPEAVRKGLAQLQNDLTSGEWDKTYGHLRRKESFDGGYMFIRFRRQLNSNV
jgi:ubiquinone/menaquinone biosynthesis C-methylase UbiE